MKRCNVLVVGLWHLNINVHRYRRPLFRWKHHGLAGWVLFFGVGSIAWWRHFHKPVDLRIIHEVRP